MAGDLHEISVAIGELRAGVRGLETAQRRGNDLFDQHCKDDEERHQQNIAVLGKNTEALAALGQAVTALTAKLDALAAKVAVMAPIVDGIQVTRSKLAVWVSIGAGALAVLGWIVEAAVKAAAAWAWSHLH